MRMRWSILVISAALPLFLVSGRAAAARPDADLHRAYFLEHQRKEYESAADLYRRVLGSDASGEVKRIARAGADRCRDQIAAKDFSRLMPADTLVYVELSRPGAIVEKLAGMVGLTTDDMHALLDERPNQSSRAMAHVPNRIAISPSIFECLRAFGGAAVAVTDFDPEEHRPPAGVLVVHHGDATLLKGLIETAFQFAPIAEKVRGMPTFGTSVPGVGNVTGVLTEGLFIAGTGRDLVEGVVARLIGSQDDALAARPDLAEINEQRKGATLFAYCNLKEVIKRVRSTADEHDLQEMKIADHFVDFDSLRWATFSMGINDGALGMQFAVRLADDHRCLAYNLMRLPPMTRQCLSKVPDDAAMFVGIGLNPALSYTVADAARGAGAEPAISGLDIFRELFGNIREIGGFVLPGQFVHGEIPNVGVVMAVNDVARSRALWDQFLAIPGAIEGREQAAARSIKIGDTPVTTYSIPECGKVYLSELDGCIALAISRDAMKSIIRAHQKNESLVRDPVMGKVVEAMPKDSSIMVGAHFGRLAKVAAGSGDPGAAMAAGPASELCTDMVGWLGVGQAPNQFTVRCSLSGLPNVNDALKKFAPMINAFIPTAPAGGHEHDGELARAEKKEKNTEIVRRKKREAP